MNKCKVLFLFCKMIWFLDFIGYQCPIFIVKEIAILSSDGDKCYNYFITGPKQYPDKIHSQTIQYQYSKHKLSWDLGDYEFTEAMEDIRRKIKHALVYIKGQEKRDFISHYLPDCRIIDLKNIPSFKIMASCNNERCEVKHGNTCARRKVYELRHYLQNNDS
jgi:hypothetical protein